MSSKTFGENICKQSRIKKKKNTLKMKYLLMKIDDVVGDLL